MVFRKSSIFFAGTLLIAGLANAQVTTFHWVQQPIGLTITCIATDGRGNCYAAGDDGYVARYTPAGILSWSENIAGLGNGGATSIALGPKGALYIAGYTYYSELPQSSQDSLAERMWIARLDTSGSLLWLVVSQNISNASANGIAVSPSGGSIYLVGTETDTIVFGGLSLSHSSNASIFVARFDPNGKSVWLRKSYDQGIYYNMSNGLSCAVDDSENVYVGGQFSDTLNFEGIHDSAAATTQAIILSIDSSGKARWVKNFGANSSVTAMCYEDGFIFASGGPYMVTRIRPDGTVDKTLQSSDAKISSIAIASDGAGDIIITGNFSATISVGSIKILNSSEKLYLFKLDTGLRPVWGANSEGTINSPAIAMDSLGHDYLCGVSTNDVRLGSILLRNNAGFLVQLDEWSLTCPLDAQGPLCTGDTLDIPVHVVGTFTNLNTFTAQMSDPLGAFSGAQTIGAVTSAKVSSIRAVIPNSLHSGTKYRIRITSSSPEVIGLDNGYDLAVLTGPSAKVTPAGTIDLCEGDSLSLTVSGGEHYLWSNGDTASQIVVGASGDYSVFAIGNNGCGILMQSAQVTVRTVPPVPPITRSGNTLFGNLNGYENQWYLNHQVIQGAMGPDLDITFSGTYNLTVSNSFHCASTSDDFVVNDLIPSGVETSLDTIAGLTISPNPSSGLVTASFALPYPERVRFSVVDVTGHKVLSKNDLTCPAGTSSIFIDIGRLASGTYFVELKTNEAVQTRRLVIER